MGYETHPDLDKAGPVSHEGVSRGRNRDLGNYPEASWIRCKKCGHTLNKARHPKQFRGGATNLYYKVVTIA